MKAYPQEDEVVPSPRALSSSPEFFARFGIAHALLSETAIDCLHLAARTSSLAFAASRSSPTLCLLFLKFAYCTPYQEER
jgi:hypothetical protein